MEKSSTIPERLTDMLNGPSPRAALEEHRESLQQRMEQIKKHQDAIGGYIMGSVILTDDRKGRSTGGSIIKKDGRRMVTLPLTVQEQELSRRIDIFSEHLEALRDEIEQSMQLLMDLRD